MLYIAVLICLSCGAGATVVATQPARRDKQISAEKNKSMELMFFEEYSLLEGTVHYLERYG